MRDVAGIGGEGTIGWEDVVVCRRSMTGSPSKLCGGCCVMYWVVGSSGCINMQS